MGRGSAQSLYRGASGLAFIYLAVFFIYPLLGLVNRSIRSADGALTLHHFTAIWQSPLYRMVLGRTVQDAFLTTITALLLGYPLALFIARSSPKARGPMLMLVIAPMLINLTVRLFGWMILLNEAGPINNLLVATGLLDAPRKLLYTRTAVIIGLAAYTLPFVVLTAYGAIRRVDETLLQAAAGLGAGPWYVFRTVTLPLTMPGIISGATISFALGASAFIIPLMLGGPRDALLANYAYAAINTLGDWGTGAAIGIILLLLVMVVVAAAGLWERRWRLN